MTRPFIRQGGVYGIVIVVAQGGRWPLASKSKWITVGSCDCIAEGSGGALFTFGANQYGQLGHQLAAHAIPQSILAPGE